jgi:uncharacterized protein (DUF1697 family)
MLAMADLRSLLESLGYGQVRTHLQSGNAIFTAPSASGPALERKIATRLEADRGLAVKVLVRSAEQVADVIAANPFVSTGADPKKLMVSFLAESPPHSLVTALDPAASLPDRFQFGDRVIYLHMPNGYMDSRLPPFEKLLGVAATTRTWRVVTRLGELTAA